MEPMSSDFSSFLSRRPTDEEIEAVIQERLPKWKVACDQPAASTVFLDQRAFGGSIDEMLLMAFAIKYARLARKNVTIQGVE